MWTPLSSQGVLDMSGQPPPIQASDAAQVPADGTWHDITGPLTGFQALEVMATVGGRPGQGQYAVVYARALNAYNPGGRWWNPFGFNFLRHKTRIRVQQSYYRSRIDQLRLRWSGQGHEYRLQIRSSRNFGTDEDGQQVAIRIGVTGLWPDLDSPGGPA